MDEEFNDNIESINDATEEVVNTEEVEVETPAVETEDESEEDVEAIKAQNRKLFERAKKAEAEARALKAQKVEKSVDSVPSEKQEGLSSMDTIALIGAKVTVKEDIDEVVDYARLKGITIEEALNTNVVKTILRDKAEQRQTAEATNTSTARRGSSRPSDETILDNASKGKLPEDAEALAEARMNLKLKK